MWQVPVGRLPVGRGPGVSGFDSTPLPTYPLDPSLGGAGTGILDYALMGNGVGIASAYKGFVQSGTGASTRTWQTKVRELVSVKDFGAVGDGVVDDAPALVVAEIAAGAAGKSLYFPAGMYKWVMGTYLHKLSNVSWYANRDATIVFSGPASGAAINNIAPGVSNCEIRGLKFDGHGAANLAWLMYFGPIANFGIEYCEFRGMQQSAAVFDGATNCCFNHNYVEKDAGPAPTTIVEAIWVRDGVIHGTGTGPTNGIEVIGNTFINMGCDLTGNDITAAYNDVHTWNYGAGVGVVGDRAVIANNRCMNSVNGADANGVFPSGMEIYANQAVVIGNECGANQGNGIHFGGRNGVVIGNLCYNNGQGGAGLGAQPYMHQGAGITARNVDGTTKADGTIYIGNRCFDSQGVKTQGYGFGADVSLANIVLGTNHFEGNRFAAAEGPFSGAASFEALASEGIQVNGGFEVDQPHAGAAVAVNFNFPVIHLMDGWFANRSAAVAAANMQQWPSAFPGYAKELLVTVTAAQPAMGADILDIKQNIEGTRFAKLKWGTAGALPLSIGFWVKSSVAGNIPLTIANYNSTAVSFAVVNIPAAGFPFWVTATFPAVTSGVWKTDADIGAALIMRIASSVGGAINIAATNGNIFEITGLTLLPGNNMVGSDLAPALMRPYSEELRLAKRFWEILQVRFDSVAHTAGSAIAWDARWSAPKRTAPTITYGPVTALGTMDVSAPTTNTDDGVTVNVSKNGLGAGPFILAFTVTGDSRMTF